MRFKKVANITRFIAFVLCIIAVPTVFFDLILSGWLMLIGAVVIEICSFVIRAGSSLGESK